MDNKTMGVPGIVPDAVFEIPWNDKESGKLFRPTILALVQKQMNPKSRVALYFVQEGIDLLKKGRADKIQIPEAGKKMVQGMLNNENINTFKDLLDVVRSSGIELHACLASDNFIGDNGLKKSEFIAGIIPVGPIAMLQYLKESKMYVYG